MSDERFAPDTPRRTVRRRLTADEEHVWSVVVRSIKPLRHAKKIASGAKHVAKHLAGRSKVAGPDAARPAKKKVAADQPAAVLRPSPIATPTPISIARREKQQLARGRAAIDARIDLHGMTQAQAHGALLRFLHRAQASGAKFVLVITGKGAPNAPRGERGVLRQQVPLWLSLPEFRACVLGYDLAHVAHGGEGALYVRLRRARG
jgi:DNA-nicking Smr family endonuclease